MQSLYNVLFAALRIESPMPVLTENDFLLMETAYGWAGDDGYTAPTQEALSTLAASIPIPAEYQREFCEAAQLLYRWFCNKALTEAVEKHKKTASVFRAKLEKIKKLAAELLEAGRVLLPEQAHWKADFMRELTTFPFAKHDDQVDSVSQFLSWQWENERNPGPSIRRF